MSRELERQALRLLNAPPNTWDGAVGRWLERNSTTGQAASMEDYLARMAERAAFMAEYLGERAGTSGTGQKDHQTAVREATRVQKRVSRALGFCPERRMLLR